MPGMKHEIIQFVGVDVLPSNEQAVLQDLCTEYYEKIRRGIKNLTSLVVHLKEYSQEGGRHKFSFHIRAVSPAHTFVSTHSSDWDLARTAHKAFENIMNQIKHELHSDEQKPHFRVPQSGEEKGYMHPQNTNKGLK